MKVSLKVHVSPSRLFLIGERFVNVPKLDLNGIEESVSIVQSSLEI